MPQVRGPSPLYNGPFVTELVVRPWGELQLVDPYGVLLDVSES